MSEIRDRPESEPLTLDRARTALGRLQYAATAVRLYGLDGELLSSYTGSFDGIRIIPHQEELRLYFDLSHFLAWLRSPDGTRLDLGRLSAFRVGSEATGDEAIELWQDGRLVMEIRPADPGLQEGRHRGR